MKLAFIEDNEVIETTTVPQGVDPKTLYHPDLTWIEVQEDQPVEPGWMYQDGAWSPPAQPPLAERRTDMIARIKAEAHRRIEDAMPTWKVIRSLTGGSAVTAGLQGEAQRLRQASNRLEALVNAMDAETLDGFNPFDDQYWTPPEE